MNKLLETACKEEEKVAKIVDSIICEIEKTILAGTANGSKDCSKNGIPMAVVSLSSVLKTPNMVLSPHCYIPKSQADLVKTNLKSVRTATDLAKKIEKMLQEKAVGEGLNKVMLSPETMEVLAAYI